MDNGVKGMDLLDAVRFLGEPAVLEQLAEECAELAQAALKMARLQRGDKPDTEKLAGLQRKPGRRTGRC